MTTTPEPNAESDAAKEPSAPWFVDVKHLRVGGRPLCGSPVDYGRVIWAEVWQDVDCAACHRARDTAPERTTP